MVTTKEQILDIIPVDLINSRNAMRSNPKTPGLRQTIIEKLEEYSNEVQYAIVFVTLDDGGNFRKETKPQKHVLKNVVLELGGFLFKLGLGRDAILL